MVYRPDVDGLRAIAILFILFFHSGLSFFPSGFIGVDIFFVISGFLIARIIHEALQNKQFSFSVFYSRRLWRLQPVFISLLIVTTLLSLFFYLPEDLLLYCRSARKASLSLANIFFANITTGYFAANSNQLPLLHTWSLAVEWQCYLFLPLIIYAVQRVAKRHFTTVIYLATLLFFVLSIYYSINNPAKTYYQFSSRIFEFLIGACVALSHFSVKKPIAELLGAFAFFILFYLARKSGINQGFPNGYALLLCLATATLIAIGQYPTFISRCLSMKLMVFIGLISYSLYIWHWPLLAFIRYQNRQEPSWFLLALFSFLFLIAYFSWRFIEKPMRQFHTIKFSHTLTYLILMPVLFTHLSAHLIKNNEGIPRRFNAETVRVYEQLKRYESIKRPLCMGKKNIDINTYCLLGSKKPGSKTGFLMGDSFANQYWGFMDVIAQNADIAVLAQATSSCLALPGIFLYDWLSLKKEIYQECYEQTTHYFNRIKTNHYDYVIIGQVWENYLEHAIINHLDDAVSQKLTKKRVAKALDKALQIITTSGAKPVLIKATAASEKNPHDCFFEHIKKRIPYDAKQCNFKVENHKEKWIKQLFLKMKHKYPELVIIDPKLIQCPDGHCKAELNGIPIFRDNSHITDYASYQFAELYLKQYSNPFIT